MSDDAIIPGTFDRITRVTRADSDTIVVEGIKNGSAIEFRFTKDDRPWGYLQFSDSSFAALEKRLLRLIRFESLDEATERLWEPVTDEEMDIIDSWIRPHTRSAFGYSEYMDDEGRQIRRYELNDQSSSPVGIRLVMRREHDALWHNITGS